MSTPLFPVPAIAALHVPAMDGNAARVSGGLDVEPAFDAAACELFQSLMRRPMAPSLPSFGGDDEEA